VHGWNENWVAKDEQFLLVLCLFPLFCLSFHWFLGCFLVLSRYVLIYFLFIAAGTWLCWLFRLFVILPRSLSLAYSFTGSLHQDRTAGSICSSLSPH
jgi:hypothetical protein